MNQHFQTLQLIQTLVENAHTLNQISLSELDQTSTAIWFTTRNGLADYDISLISSDVWTVSILDPQGVEMEVTPLPKLTNVAMSVVKEWIEKLDR